MLCESMSAIGYGLCVDTPESNDVDHIIEEILNSLDRQIKTPPAPSADRCDEDTSHCSMKS